MAAPNAGDLNKRTYNGMGLNFAQGPVALSLATQSYEASTTSTVKSLALGGSINLEKAVVFLGTTTTNDGSAKAATGQTFGIKIPVGENYVSLAWARGTQATETLGWGVQYIYNWNKSAVIYTGYKTVQDPAATTNTAGVGVRYDF
jgi:predicted porin